jgi:site-specific recombinase XerC
MKQREHGQAKKSPPKHSPNLPDLDQSRSAVLNSLPSKESQRGYRHAIDEFIEWYCSEPRLSFSKAAVTRYRIHLESRQLAANTINGRLAAVRRLAYEAADSGLLSPDLAAGIRRAKGAKCLSVRLGNWLTATQARALWQVPDPSTPKGKRDRALLGILLGCGLRRGRLQSLRSPTSNGGRTTGPSSTWLAKVDTSAQYRFPTGSRRPLTPGVTPQA